VLRPIVKGVGARRDKPGGVLQARREFFGECGAVMAGFRALPGGEMGSEADPGPYGGAEGGRGPFAATGLEKPSGAAR